MIYQQPLPAPYPQLTDAACEERIRQARKELGSQVVVLAHHYQRPEIVAFGDFRGDSLKLAQLAASQTEARYIVYCGVHFMAESADILKPGQQTVVLPDLGAGCDMADMAEAPDVADAWAELLETYPGAPVVPVTYINSTAALKAFVGEREGYVCTSSNAAKIVTRALEQAGPEGKVFFFPDQHLGRNTCRALGIPLERIKLWDPELPLGGLGVEELKSARVLLWKGHCPVHMMFTAKQVEALRAKDPQVRIIAHPECSMDVVGLADDVGSTEFIVSRIAASPPGSSWAVGTEMNLVRRIAMENPDKKVVSINPYMCLCGTMNRIDLPHLAWAMERLVAGEPVNVIAVHDPVRTLARRALDRMLELS
jgi:quinolinate synthase